MSRARHLWRLACAVLFLPTPAFASSFPWDDYGPACQWVRLAGHLERPAGLRAEEPVLLTVTYRLPEQKNPSTLLTNFPIKKEKFLFVLAGFHNNIEGVLFVPPVFFFADRIEFQYFAVSADRRRRSATHHSVYRPERIKRDGKVLCQTRIVLETLKLEE